MQRQHGLDADAQPGHIEGLKHDLCSHLPVLWRVQGRLRQDEVVIPAVHSQISAKPIISSMELVEPQQSP